MSQQMRVYLKREAVGDHRTFCGKAVKKNTEPGWPGEEYADFELSQFFEDVPIMKKGIREQIEQSPEFTAVSITTPIEVINMSHKKDRNWRFNNVVWITLDTLERPYLATIWASTIAEAITCMKELVPAPPCACK